MSNCVYHAFADCLFYHFASFVDWYSWLLYKALKMGCGYGMDEPTWGGVAPFIVRNMALAHGFGVRIQHRLITKPMYVGYPEATIFQQAIAAQSDFGEYADPLTLEPSIYLMLGSNHAEYALYVPRDRHPVMAMQLYRRNSR